MNIKNILFYVMIIIIIALSIYMIYWTKSDGGKCMTSPFQYGIKTLSNDNATCSCSIPMSSKTLIITKDNISYSDYNPIIPIPHN